MHLHLLQIGIFPVFYGVLSSGAQPTKQSIINPPSLLKVMSQCEDEMSLEDVIVRPAQPSDIPLIVDLVEYVARESNNKNLYDEAHSWEHVTGIVCNGVSFIAEIDNTPIGVLMCSHVDIAYAQTSHLETQHLYVIPAARRTKATARLLDAAEDYADKRGIIVIFHQMDYQSAINGSENNSKRVERLFKSRGYDGPVDTAGVGQERRRVGVSYRYVGKPLVEPS